MALFKQKALNAALGDTAAVKETLVAYGQELDRLGQWESRATEEILTNFETRLTKLEDSIESMQASMLKMARMIPNTDNERD